MNMKWAARPSEARFLENRFLEPKNFFRQKIFLIHLGCRARRVVYENVFFKILKPLYSEKN